MNRTATLPWRPAAARNPKGWQTNAPCLFFAQGKCRNGQACSFSHSFVPEPLKETSLAADMKATSPVATSPGGDTRKQVTCHFYLLGSCLKGDSCPFSHNIDVEVGEKGEA